MGPNLRERNRKSQMPESKQPRKTQMRGRVGKIRSWGKGTLNSPSTEGLSLPAWGMDLGGFSNALDFYKHFSRGSIKNT